MAGTIMYLINRSGRCHARLVVPKDLRGIAGKSGLGTSLGDYRRAFMLLRGAVTHPKSHIDNLLPWNFQRSS